MQDARPEQTAGKNPKRDLATRPWRVLLGVVGLCPLLIAGPCERTELPAKAAPALALAQGFHLDKTQSDADLQVLTKAAHPFGSPHQAEVATWLEQRLKSLGLPTAYDSFSAEVPNPAASAVGPFATTVTRQGANIYAAATSGKKPCVIAFATHYDSKDVAGTSYLGANDGGSSTVVVLQLLRYLHQVRGDGLGCSAVGWFFDGEEAVLPNWSDGQESHPARLIDHTYGSRYLASRLSACKQAAPVKGNPPLCLPPALGGQELAALILLDMVGSPRLQITQDQISSPALELFLAQGLQALGHASALSDHISRVEDDHEPFAMRGVRTVDLIDFEHLNYWHRAGDEPATLDSASLELAGQAALFIARSVP